MHTHAVWDFSLSLQKYKTEIGNWGTHKHKNVEIHIDEKCVYTAEQSEYNEFVNFASSLCAKS